MLLSWLALAGLTHFSAHPAWAGGPKYVAGASYFNPAVKGQPVHWAGGRLVYFVDQGALSATISNAQATAMVDAAAAVWNAVPTAAVTLSDAGQLAENVDGATISVSNGVIIQPLDLAPGAIGTPVGVVFDISGAVIEAIGGAGASQPDNCARNGVLVWIDTMNPDATLAHGVIVLNGRCTTSANLLAMMQYQLERAFGRMLGLDDAQVNDNALTTANSEPNAALAWPIMDALGGDCGQEGGNCIPNPGQLRFDDIAALNRIYPVTATNLPSFPGKSITAANTVSLQGSVSFRDGTGMQGVNVVARPLDGNGNPLYQYTVSFVSGGYFAGNRGNAITGYLDAEGNRLDRFGSDDPTLQGYFDLSGVPLPPGVTVANYQVSFEAVNPLYIGPISVGPYILGSPAPSGTPQTVQVNGLQAGSQQTLTIRVGNSAAELAHMPATHAIQKKLPKSPQSPIVPVAPIVPVRNGPAGVEIQPEPLPATGLWTSRLGSVGASDWFIFPVRGNRQFTVVTQALDETGMPSATKAMPAIGVWDGFDSPGTTAVGFAGAENSYATGATWLQVASAGDDVVRLGIADERGDGRPDYLYRGWVLYADSVNPARLPAAGGAIVIRGCGFRTGDTVTVGGVAAQVTSILPTEIMAQVPANNAAVTGSLDVQVVDQPQFNAVATIPAGISYDSASTDLLNVVTAPGNQIPLNVPEPFTVVAEGADGNPAGGVTVTFAVTSGTATLGCGQLACAVTATGDGRATVTVTATNTAIAAVTASLSNGATVQAHFYGGTPSAVTALTPTLYLAAGAVAQWPVQALVQSGGSPANGAQVSWQSVTGIVAPAAFVNSNAAGVASTTLTAGPLAEGQTATSKGCQSGTNACASFSVFGARPELASLAAVSGTSQSMAVGTVPAPVVLRLLDTQAHPMAGGTVTVSESLYAWEPPCPPHGRCTQAQLLAAQTLTLTSALDGTVTLNPITLPGVATNLVGLAATGSTATLNFAVEQHP